MYPTSEGEFTRISGVGQVKLHDFGATFIGEINSFLASNPRQMFADDSFAAPPPTRSRLNDTARETLRHFRAGRSVEEIARARLLAFSTICGHLTTAADAGEVIDLNQLLTAEEQEAIRTAFKKCGFGNLVGAHEYLSAKFDMSLLRLCRAVQQRVR